MVIALAALVLLYHPVMALAQEPPPLTLTSFFTRVAVKPGDTITTTLQVKSDLTAPVEVLFSVEKPQGWGVELRSMGYNVTAIYVSPGERRSIDIRIKIPDNASPGVYQLLVKAVGGGAESNPVRFVITVGRRPALKPLDLRVSFPSLNGQPGDTLEYRFDVKNNLDRDVTVDFTVEEAPPGWDIFFKPSTFERRVISSITVRSGFTETGLVVSVKIPETAKPGEYRIRFAVSTEGYREEAALIARVTGIRRYLFTTPTGLLSVEVEAGGLRNVTLLIINEGTETLRDTSISVVPPAGWNVKVIPEEVDILEPGRTATLTLSINPPANSLAGDYRLRVTASNELAGTKTIDLRVTVTKQAYWGVIGVVVVVASVLALLVIFWKFGRP